MTKHDIVEKWHESANEDLAVARELLTNKRYAYCLFFYQLSVEKILKAVIINLSDDAPPITYDLVMLAITAKLLCSELQIEQLREITSFNVEARYDIQKDRLYKKATPEYTSQYFTITKELFSWIQTKLS